MTELSRNMLGKEYRKAKLAREMAHEAWRPPEDLETAKGMIDMLAQEAFGPYGAYRSGEETINALKEGQLGWAALAGLGMLPGIPAMTVWHGSPHKFAPTERNALGEFDASKIGSGEGAQAYGHGLYFAEEPGVARAYIPQEWIPEAVSDPYGIGQDAAGRVGNKGHLYTVDLPDEHINKMLDWDKPLSEQPERVRNSLKELLELHQPSGSVVNANRNTGYARWDQDLTGAQARELLELKMGKGEVEKALRAAGIPGIRYLDQGSRSAGQGTSNYVVFDPAIARILGRE